MIQQQIIYISIEIYGIRDLLLLHVMHMIAKKDTWIYMDLFIIR